MVNRTPVLPSLLVGAVLCLLVGLSGCRPRSKAPSVAEQRVAELKDRPADIPVPLATHLKEMVPGQQEGPRIADREKNAAAERGFVFETALSLDELALFYESEAEVMGWKKLFEISKLDDQLVMFFEKPHKRLLMIVDPLRSAQRVRLFYKTER